MDHGAKFCLGGGADMLVKKNIFMICPAGSFFRYPLPRLAKTALPNISVGI